MKQTQLIIIFLFWGYLIVDAQDTLIPSRNYTCKLGLKTLVEKSTIDGDTKFTVGVASFGLQAIFKIGKSKSSIESGLYYLNRAANYYWSIYVGPEEYLPQYLKITYGNLHIPINYRLDTKYIYFDVGVYFDYLLKTNVPFEELPGALPYTYGTDRKLNFGWNIGIGYEQSCSKTLSLFAEAEVNSNFSQAKVEDGYWGFKYGTYYPGFSNYGFAFGLNYKLLRKN